MLRGGVADKLGNDYEAHWTLIEALRVLRGHAEEIRLEAFNEDATGFEFRVTTSGRNVWHQCKRRRASGSWTMHALATEGVLASFGRKLADVQNECVFVSSDPAAAFKALIDKARLVGTASDYVASLSLAHIDAAKQLEVAWGESPEITYDRLRRCRVETVSDYSLLREARAVCGLTFRADPNIAIERLEGFLDTKLTLNNLDGHMSEERLVGEMGYQLATVLMEGHTRFDESLDDIYYPVDRLGPTVEDVGRALFGREESPVGVLGNRHGTSVRPC